MLIIPIMVNSKVIGEVFITRQEMFSPDRGSAYVYRWDAEQREATLLDGTKIPKASASGTLHHRYSDGSWALVAEVMKRVDRALPR